MRVEHRQPLIIGYDRLTVDYARTHLQRPHGLDDLRKAAGKIVAVAAHQADGLAPRVGQDAEAVVLDLVNPARARRRRGGGSRQARIERWRGSIGANTAPSSRTKSGIVFKICVPRSESRAFGVSCPPTQRQTAPPSPPQFIRQIRVVTASCGRAEAGAV
jgi:hypothetical protein